MSGCIYPTPWWGSGRGWPPPTGKIVPWPVSPSKMIWPGLERLRDNMKLSITASFVSTDLSQAAPGHSVATEKTKDRDGCQWVEGKLLKRIKYPLKLELCNNLTVDIREKLSSYQGPIIPVCWCCQFLYWLSCHNWQGGVSRCLKVSQHLPGLWLIIFLQLPAPLNDRFINTRQSLGSLVTDRCCSLRKKVIITD